MNICGTFVIPESIRPFTPCFVSSKALSSDLRLNLSPVNDMVVGDSLVCSDE